MGEFYTYLWLRKDGTPYYVGKGKGKRGFTSSSHGVKCPKDRSRILTQEFPSEKDAFAAENFLIEFYGRLDLGTGRLRNLTNGGDQPPLRSFLGRKHTLESRLKVSASCKGRIPWNRGVSASEELRQKMRDGRRSMKLSEVHKENIGKGLRGKTKGRKLTDAHRRKLSISHLGQVPWNKGKKFVEINSQWR